MYKLLAAIYLDKIGNWSEIKEQSSWINVAFKDEKEINNNSHICFPFTTKSLNYLASFSNYLVGGNNKEPDFTAGEKKISIFNFQIEIFFKGAEG